MVGRTTDELHCTNLLQLGDRFWGHVNDKMSCNATKMVGWQTDALLGIDLLAFGDGFWYGVSHGSRKALVRRLYIP